MTMLNIPPKTLAAIDKVRKSRGIRTRIKALEVVLSEALENEEVVLSPADARRLKARLARTETEVKIGLSQIKVQLRANQSVLMSWGIF